MSDRLAKEIVALAAPADGKKGTRVCDLYELVWAMEDALEKIDSGELEDFSTCFEDD